MILILLNLIVEWYAVWRSELFGCENWLFSIDCRFVIEIEIEVDEFIVNRRFIYFPNRKRYACFQTMRISMRVQVKILFFVWKYQGFGEFHNIFIVLVVCAIWLQRYFWDSCLKTLFNKLGNCKSQILDQFDVICYRRNKELIQLFYILVLVRALWSVRSTHCRLIIFLFQTWIKLFIVFLNI